MADETDIANALVKSISTVIYPFGTASPPVGGVHAKVYQGWPDPLGMKADFGKRVAHISIFPSPQVKITTRRMPEWEQVVAPAPTLAAAVAGQAITLSGVVSTPQAVALIIDGQDYAYGVRDTDTLASIAASLTLQVSADRQATSAGAVMTIPNAKRLIARIVANGTSAKEVARELRTFKVSIWAACHDDREALAKLLKPLLADLTRMTMADGSTATIEYAGSQQVDSEQKQGIYRRDIDLAIEYATIVTRQDTTVQIVQVRPSVGIDQTSVPLPIINT